MKLTNKKRMEFLKNALNVNHNLDLYIEDLVNKPEVYLFNDMYNVFEAVIERVMENMNEIRKNSNSRRLVE